MYCPILSQPLFSSVRFNVITLFFLIHQVENVKCNCKFNRANSDIEKRNYIPVKIDIITENVPVEHLETEMQNTTETVTEGSAE